jgi:medium-chain acyl-[acyl-carrier-protein] hydrolase
LRGVATHVFYGTQDSIPQEQVAAWQRRIASPVGIEPVQGGHFYIHDEREALLAAIARRLSVGLPHDTTAMAI